MQSLSELAQAGSSWFGSSLRVCVFSCVFVVGVGAAISNRSIVFVLFWGYSSVRGSYLPANKNAALCVRACLAPS